MSYLRYTNNSLSLIDPIEDAVNVWLAAVQELVKPGILAGENTTRREVLQAQNRIPQT